MPKEPMSTFVAGGKEFEIVDKAARELSESSLYLYKWLSRTTITEDTSHVMQGGTGYEDKIYFCVPSSDYTSGSLREFQDDTHLRSVAVTNGAHMNDAAYCEKDGCVYIATGNNNIVVVDTTGTSMVQKADITLSHTVNAILWDPVNECFFCNETVSSESVLENKLRCYRYTYDWELIDNRYSSFRVDGYDSNISGQNGQGIVYLGKYYGAISNYVTRDLYVKNVLIIFDPDTLKVVKTMVFPANRGDDEIQFAYYYDGTIYAFSGNNVIRYYRIYLDKNRGKDIRDTVSLVNTTGIPLKSGAALDGADKVTRPGLYYIDSRSSASPVTGIPGCYDGSADGEWLQIPFGLHELLGIFSDGVHVSTRYKGKYTTLLTHNDVERISYPGGFAVYIAKRVVICTGTFTVTPTLPDGKNRYTFSIASPPLTGSIGQAVCPTTVIYYTNEDKDITETHLFVYSGYSSSGFNFVSMDTSTIDTTKTWKCRLLGLLLMDNPVPSSYYGS